jgi:hypothetical protein
MLTLPSVRLIHGARRSHRGVRVTGSVTEVKKMKPKAVKTSALRRDRKFNSADQSESAAPKIAYQLPTERSKDNRSLEEKAEVINWVCEPCLFNRVMLPNPIPHLG